LSSLMLLGGPGLWYERGLKRLGLALAIAAALGGCKEKNALKVAPPPTPASSTAPPVRLATGKLRSETAKLEYAVFFLPRPTSDPDKALAGACKAQAAPFERVARPQPATTARPTLAVRRGEDKAFADTEDRLLDIASEELSIADRAALKKSAPALWLAVSARAPSLTTAVRYADELAACVARATGYVVYDFSRREIFAAEALRERRVDSCKGDVRCMAGHFTNHVYADGELVREVTLGLEKFGLPDLAVSDVPRTLGSEIGMVVNFTAQALAQSDVVPPSGRVTIDPAKLPAGAGLTPTPGGTGDVTLTWTEREEGDADNRLLAIGFDAAAGATAQERQAAFVEKLGLRGDDKPFQVEHDAALLRASARARKRMLALKPKFDAGFESEDQLMIKAPFTTSDGGNEWMWVEVTAWKGDIITGVLMNEPAAVPNLRAGARVTVATSRVFDYVYRHGDAREGGETEKILKERMGKSDEE